MAHTDEAAAAAIRQWIDAGADPQDWGDMLDAFLTEYPRSTAALERAWRTASKSHDLGQRPPRRTDGPADIWH